MIWENLNIDEFEIAVKESKGVVLVPIGCLEKHGSHMPIGTDIFIARHVSILASEKEKAMVPDPGGGAAGAGFVPGVYHL